MKDKIQQYFKTQWANSNEYIQQTIILQKKWHSYSPPDLALWLTLNGSNYVCVEHISIIPKIMQIESHWNLTVW